MSKNQAGMVGVEKCLDGEIRTRRNSRGQPLEIRYLRDGKTRGFMLKLEPGSQKGRWEPESGQDQFMEVVEGGRGMLFSSWHDGAEFECDYQKWIDGHLADMRRLAVEERWARCRKLLGRRDYKKACELYEELVRYMGAADWFKPAVGVEFAECLARVGRTEEARMFFDVSTDCFRKHDCQKEARAAEKMAGELLGRDSGFVG